MQVASEPHRCSPAPGSEALPFYRFGLLTTALAYAAFISLGLPDGLLGVGWPSIRQTFGLRVDALGAFLTVFTGGYLISSFSSGRILSRLSVGTLLSLSCVCTSFSLLGQALACSWSLFVACGLIAGIGAGAIDTGLNIYGARTFSTRVMNWLHACYGIGAATGPLVMTTVLISGRSWRIAYAIVAIAQSLLAISFAATRRSWGASQARRDHSIIAPSSYAQTLQRPVVWLSIALFFLYTGLEQATGVWIYSYLTQTHFMPSAIAGVWVSVYWATLTVGRIVSGGIAAGIPPHTILIAAIMGLIVAAALIWMAPENTLRCVGVALMGFACAPIFPTLIATTPARVGESHSANAISFQVAASILGQSLIPAVVGIAANQRGLQIVGPWLFVSAVLTAICFELMRIARRTSAHAARRDPGAAAAS